MNDSKILTILIPTKPGREAGLQELLHELNRQIAAGKYPVHLETYWNNGRSKKIGTIRNEMINNCSTKYLAFFDDDDQPSKNYIESIVQVLLACPDIDAVGFIVDVKVKGVPAGNARISNDYDDWKTNSGPAPFLHERTINHLAVVKTELARQAGFPDINHGEDYEYSKRLKPLLKNCFTIHDTLYYYLFEPNKSN